ncbi:paramyosin isoform X2 [Anabrus simplex]|uniref:paramyosin isoform X2 n=1 Tax=Anabrus simplex TaxID=316456 RepID=UPI0034DD09B7
MENNNKESLKLLGMSASGSDSGSPIQEFLVTPRKKRVRRRIRGTSSSRSRQQESCHCKGRTIGLSLAVTLLLCWLIVLTWLAFVLHGELKRLDTNVRRVVAGNQDVPEALQKCHSLSRDLQQNQTALFNHLEALTLQLRNFSAQLTVVQYGLRDMEERLKAAPELVNMPRDLHALSSSVASFGSQIGDLNATVSALKAQNNQLQETSKSLVQNITSVKQSVSQLLTVSQQPQDASKQKDDEKEAMLAIMAHISQNISLVNDTLTKKLQWVSDDQKTDHKAIDTLRELSQNVSARVTTLEGECTKSSAQAALMSTVNNITEQVGSNEGQLHDLNTRVLQLQDQYSQLKSNGSQLTMAVNDVRQAVSKLKEQYPPVLRVQPSNKEPSKPSPDVPAT